jgi:cold shock CspA family protein
MKNTIPTTLNFDGRAFNFTGESRTAGAYNYVDAAESELVELYRARVVSTGPHFSLAHVPANPALGTICIDPEACADGALTEGDAVLAGGLSFPNGKPRARYCHLLSKRKRGVLVYLHNCRTWGKLELEHAPDAEDVFVHESDVSDGRLIEGARYSFVTVRNDEGPAARSCRRA